MAVDSFLPLSPLLLLQASTTTCARGEMTASSIRSAERTVRPAASGNVFKPGWTWKVSTRPTALRSGASTSGYRVILNHVVVHVGPGCCVLADNRWEEIGEILGIFVMSLWSEWVVSLVHNQAGPMTQLAWSSLHRQLTSQDYQVISCVSVTWLCFSPAPLGY